MKQNVKFYICSVCKNQIGMIHHSGKNVCCCNQEMQLMESQNVSNELTYKIDNNKIIISTNSDKILWIALVGNNKTIRKTLEYYENDIVFENIPESTIYAYSSEKGLLRLEIKS